MTHSLCWKNTNSIPTFRQRYNPTFYHQQIFNNGDLDLHKSRYTPTFHSTVLDTQGYNIKTIHKKNQKQVMRPNSAVQGVYSNNTQRKRIEQLNPHNSIFNGSGSQWLDHTKQNMISSLVDCRNHGYSKERKYLQLSSDPVFTDYNYGTKNSKILQSRQTFCTEKLINKDQNQLNQINKPNEHIQERVIQNQQPVQTRQQNNQQTDSKQAKKEKANDKKINKQINSSSKKDFHKNCIPEIEKQLKLKGKKIAQRPQTARKANVISQKPIFTVIRKNKIPPSC